MESHLILEDGTAFIGTSIDSEREVINEIVFNTSMTGCLEVLTDPSYAGQVIVMTCPLIGNYRICHQDMEPAELQSDGYIARELSRIPSNFRDEGTIQNFLKERDIPDVYGIDTKALTRILREKGIINGMITTKEYTDFSEPIRRMKEYAVTGVMLKATTKEAYVLPGNSKKVALMDYDARRNIARSLNQRGCEVAVYPADTPTREVLARKPDGITLSNGLGDLEENIAIIEEVKVLYELDMPIFIIYPKHQLMALANDMGTHKLKYGHRSRNHPMRDLGAGRVYVSSQSHGYVASADDLGLSVTVPAFVNVNDSANEGLKYVSRGIFTVQYYPEAYLESLDSGYLFDRFLKTMEVNG